MKQRLPGVYPSRKKDNTEYFRASLTYRRKHISLGSFDTMVKAHLAYREALELLETSELAIEDYTEYRLLSFDKWVSLVNFRDNGIYFCNPIYTKQNFFYYYLSPSYELIFDIDDLFYYSSHKIMKRNGHLFVTDYGMQYNILNRYGIKNYAVEGRDYRFINGNSLDFRYENIEILNRYHGVTQIKKNGKTYYKARIHIRSYYLVGTYSSEVRAAIAYNKAIDILEKQGIRRNYSPNYIEGLSGAEYAEIYTGIKVSPTIYRLSINSDAEKDGDKTS